MTWMYQYSQFIKWTFFYYYQGKYEKSEKINEKKIGNYF